MLTLYSLLHYYQEYPEWTVHESNFQSLDPVSVCVDGEGRVKCVRTPEARRIGDPPVVVQKKNSPFTLKLLPLMRADGTLADPLVGIMHCSEVPKDEIYNLPLPKFSPNAGGWGEIWMVNDTHGNDLRLCNKWLVAKLVVPSFAATLSATRSMASRSKEVNEVGVFQCDGEREQLDVFTSPQCIQALRDLGVNGMKHSAGSSLLWQANDVGHCHSSLHKFVNEQTYAKNLSPGDVEEVKIGIETLQDSLKREGKPVIGSKTVAKLLRLYSAIQPALGMAFNPSAIKSSFSKCGLWTGKDCDIEEMLLRSDAFKNMKEDEYNKTLERVKKAARDPRTGLCFEFELDDLGIPLTPEEEERRNNPKKVPLNLMTDQRQRALIFTGEGYTEWLANKARIVEEEENKKEERKKGREKRKMEAERQEVVKRARIDKEARIARCLGSANTPPPLPVIPVPKDVKCLIHGCWRGTWLEEGLPKRGWGRCRKCGNYFCPKCSNVVRTHERTCTQPRALPAPCSTSAPCATRSRESAVAPCS